MITSNNEDTGPWKVFAIIGIALGLLLTIMWIVLLAVGVVAGINTAK